MTGARPAKSTTGEKASSLGQSVRGRRVPVLGFEIGLRSIWLGMVRGIG